VLENIGKILFVDDKYDDAMKQAITALIEKGMPVQYWNSKGEFPKTIRDVRVVVLDLDLEDIGERTAGDEYYLPAVEALHKIPGAFIVVIMAQDFNDDDPSKLMSYYEEQYKAPLCGFVAKEGLSKSQELEDPSRLEKLIETSIQENKIFSLILLWEAIADYARDRALSDLVSKELENTILALIKSLCIPLGEEAAARELVAIMMRLVSRRTHEIEKYSELGDLIKELNAKLIEEGKEYPGDRDLSLYSRLMFYKPDDAEGIWTGDVYEVEESSKHEKYAIVLTGNCDFAQGKATRALVCFGFPINEVLFSDPEYPPYKTDPAVIKCLGNGMKVENMKEYMKNRYLKGKSLPSKFHAIWNFRDEAGACGICFDLSNVRSTEIENVKKWKRVSRLDSPFVEELLEKYGHLVSRIGTLAINLSPDQLRDSLDLLKEKEKKKKNQK